jgi:Fe-coproporphyrin III synthase
MLNCLKQENSPLYQKSLNLLQKFGGNKIGVKLFAVDSAGNVHPDQFWQNYSLGNVTEKNLEDICINSYDIFKDKSVFASDRCRNCYWLKICGTNYRFFGKGSNSEWFLEPECYL